MAINEYLDRMNEFGLNTKFNQTIRELIYNNIRLGNSLSDINKIIDKNIAGKDKALFKKYYTQNTQIARTAYSSIINQEIVNKNKSRIKGFTITGTLIDNSSPQCKKFVELGRSLTIETIKKEIMPLAVKKWLSRKQK